jgi:hypothetical protein
LRCPLEVVLLNLGLFFGFAAGKNLMFGADSSASGWTYSFRSLMEFDGGEVLTALRPPS